MMKQNILVPIAVFLFSLKVFATVNCNIKPGTIGHSERNPLQHIVIIMQENHSFDSYFGRLNDKRYYGADVDGISQKTNPQAYFTGSFCPKDPDHSWEGLHRAFNSGKLDQFEQVNDENGVKKAVYEYQDESSLGFYYDLANHFAIGDRYFSSVMGPTFPNRFYLYAATSFGYITNIIPENGGYDQKTVFDSLSDSNISWKYYYSNPGHYLDLFKGPHAKKSSHFARVKEFVADVKADRLPQVIVLESSEDRGDEHPPANVKIGQEWVYENLKALMNSPSWKTSAVFITWDENGGFYDHVAPPEACAPDSLTPASAPTEFKAFDRLGFRVPFLLISPFAKHHYVSHKVFDHASIVKFIEDQYGLPYLTYRDANSNSMSDLFDFAHPDFSVPIVRDPHQETTLGCDDLRTWGQNQYNHIANWFKELMADFGHSDLL